MNYHIGTIDKCMKSTFKPYNLDNFTMHARINNASYTYFIANHDNLGLSIKLAKVSLLTLKCDHGFIIDHGLLQDLKLIPSQASYIHQHTRPNALHGHLYTPSLHAPYNIGSCEANYS